MEFETYSTGGDLISTPEDRGERRLPYPSFQGSDQKQSFYVDFGAAQPNPRGEPGVKHPWPRSRRTPSDEIFYEKPGAEHPVRARVGWPYRGGGGLRAGPNLLRRCDVGCPELPVGRILTAPGTTTGATRATSFGLYREAKITAPTSNIYGGVAPGGGGGSPERGASTGLKLAGPELWWGANPTALVEVRDPLAGLRCGGDLPGGLRARQSAIAMLLRPCPRPRTGRPTLYLPGTVGGWGWSWGDLVGSQAGGAGLPGGGDDGRCSRTFVKDGDTFGRAGPGRVESGAHQTGLPRGPPWGLVAATGAPPQIQTFTGWRLADSGMGNQWNLMSASPTTRGAGKIAPKRTVAEAHRGGPGAVGRRGPRAPPEHPWMTPSRCRANIGRPPRRKLLITFEPPQHARPPGCSLGPRHPGGCPPGRQGGPSFFSHHHNPERGDRESSPTAGRPSPSPGLPPAEDLWDGCTRTASSPSGWRGWGLILKPLPGPAARPNGELPPDQRALRPPTCGRRWDPPGSRRGRSSTDWGRTTTPGPSSTHLPGTAS